MIRPLIGLLLALQAGLALAKGRPVDVVQALYREFAWEAVLVSSATDGFAEQTTPRLRRHLTAELSDALIRDRQCAKRRREICALDFAPLWGSQDPAATDLQVLAGASPTEVLVVFTDGPLKKQLRLRMRREAAGWRVDDIEYPQGSSLRQLLRDEAHGHR